MEKFDYTSHPEADKLIPCKASAHIPEWSKLPAATAEDNTPKESEAKKPPEKTGVVETDKYSIMSRKRKGGL